MERQMIVDMLRQMLPENRVITDKKTLEKNSIDRFRKYEDIKGVYTQPLPAAVVKVADADEVSKVLSFANQHGINVVPRTGGSATEGGLETAVKDSIVVDGSLMSKILSIDPTDMQVTAQCGVVLETLENILREQGFTTGHSPQSKPLAMMGGLVATRSIGQFSTLYGGIEDMVVGLEAVLPDGTVTRIKNVPRRAAGPDIRHILIGNEGSLAFITEVTVKIFKYRPENNIFLGYVIDDMKTGLEILREVMVEGLRPSVARLYDPEDGHYYFSHFANNRCVLVFMTEGEKQISKYTAEAIDTIVRANSGAAQVESKLIEDWFNNLNWDVSKVEDERQQILETDNIGFTTEVSGSWSVIHDIYVACMERVRKEIPDITMLGGHSSHSYINGTNIYFMYYYDLVDIEPEEEIEKYHDPINKIIVEETLKLGGSMVHHHGIGKHRTAWVEQEHGSAYVYLTKLKEAFDPNGIMNAGTVYPLEK
ncbi:FAD-binding oxidoreductase [Schaalia vaccimaxillae]|uniref:FAD-binding oxidoreductase n=1 Tax=Schaalia vaccimaxillae TaxID=183916 RepID=UPI0003B4A046|nr:FAD-binding oxidoreductase [Schaalia vaccimaxillae]